MNVHFICRGNILRSLVAETYLKSLNLKNLHVTSSGTNVNWEDETERKYFSNTLRLLNNHGIEAHVKDLPEQLTQSIQHFFEHYKDLEAGKWVKVTGWVGPEQARMEIQTSMDRYKKI